ncbi:MAG: transcription termination factor NusA [Candidatus Omnitrophota bacterium]
MANEELLSVLEYIERERGVEKEILFNAIESALKSAARKIVGKKVEDIEVKISRETGDIKVKAEGKEVKSAEFGRIAAQTAKQVIIQKIREAERDVIYTNFHGKLGSIVSGLVHRFERGDIIVDLGKTEGILPRSQQCHRERYKQGERLRAYVLDVKKDQRGPGIILSRTHEGLVKKLFEIEVPEILEGIVEIRGVSREPGERTKIAVYSKNEKVDSVGACVGVRGSRVKSIVNELHNERIDIVRWSEDIKEYAKASLSPAEVSSIRTDTDSKRLYVTVPDDQLSIAIGKHGQNVRLASKLLGWEIDVRSVSQPRDIDVLQNVQESQEQEIIEVEVTLDDLEGVGKKTKEALVKAGLSSVLKILEIGVEGLVKVDGIGKKTAEKIIKSAEEFLPENEERSEGPAAAPEAAETASEAEAVSEVIEEKDTEENGEEARQGQDAAGPEEGENEPTEEKADGEEQGEGSKEDQG